MINSQTFSFISVTPTLISEEELSESIWVEFFRFLVGVLGGDDEVSQGQTSSDVEAPGTILGFLTLF